MFPGRIFWSYLLVSSVAGAQTTELPNPDQQPSYANYSIMLVAPAVGGGAVAIMHNPKNELEFVDVSRTKDAFAAGYLPVRAIELGELIAGLKEENARLASENARLLSRQPNQTSVPTATTLNPAEIEAEQRAVRRQQMLQTWLMLQNANRPQPFRLPMPVNPNANRLKTNCTTQTLGNTSTTNCN